MFKGKIVFRFADRDETYEGAEVLMFQPTDELAKTMEVMMKNFPAASQQA